jgi:hypothetical protein
VNICHAGPRDKPGPKRATYNFDPPTLVESTKERRMRHYPQEAGPSWVEAAFSKGDGCIGTRKHCGDELVCQATGLDF